MKRCASRFLILAAPAVLFSLSGCRAIGVARAISDANREMDSPPRPAGQTLTDARRGFKTKIVRKESARQPVPQPPANVLRLVRYPSPAGKLAAYVTPNALGSKKRPAIIWITGGDCNTIDEGIWQDAPPENDQTARAFRDAGIVTIYPSLRGGSDNPGVREGFYGEVDDIKAAREYLAKQPGVDPKCIYLGGHSTGGTLAFLVAESSSGFRAVFPFGAVDDVTGYGEEYIPADLNNRKEMELRSPGLWLNSIRTPTIAFEGEQGNIESHRAMMRSNSNPQVRFFTLAKADHFSILAPTTKRLARKIATDDGRKPFTFSAADLKPQSRQ